MGVKPAHRPPLDPAKRRSVTVRFRATERTAAAYNEAAHRSGLARSQWIRAVCDAAADYTPAPPPLHWERGPVPRVFPGAVLVVDRDGILDAFSAGVPELVTGRSVWMGPHNERLRPGATLDGCSWSVIPAPGEHLGGATEAADR